MTNCARFIAISQAADLANNALVHIADVFDHGGRYAVSHNLQQTAQSRPWAWSSEAAYAVRISLKKSLISARLFEVLI